MRAVLVALNERPSIRVIEAALNLLDVLLDLLLEVKSVLPSDSPPGAGSTCQAPLIPLSLAPQSPGLTLSNAAAIPSSNMEAAIYRLFLSCITRSVIRRCCAYIIGSLSSE